MSLYKDTYGTIVTNIANSIYNKIKNLVLNIDNKKIVFCRLTTANNIAEYAPVASKRNQKIITETVDGKFPSDHYGLFIELNI